MFGKAAEQEETLMVIQANPHEIANLTKSNKPEHRDAVLRVRAALDVWIAETGDLGQWSEPLEIVAPFEKEMQDWLGTPEWYLRRTRCCVLLSRWLRSTRRASLQRNNN